MRKKIGWLILSCLMALSLVLASCAPAVVEEEEAAVEGEVVAEEEVAEEEVAEEEVAEEEVVEEEVVEEGVETVTFTVYKLDGTPVTKTVEKPRYGGRLTHGLYRTHAGFDPAWHTMYQSHHMWITNEGLMAGDWARGTAGTEESSWLLDSMPPEELRIGWLAESWEYQAPDTIIFHIRPGVYYWDKAPANGRELVAADFVFGINRRYFDDPQGEMYDVVETSKPVSVTAPDKYTLVIKVVPGYARRHHQLLGVRIRAYPPEVIEEFGDMADWRNVIGTGPFMLVDYVPQASFKLDRNPNYWQKHPLFGDQMPYLDGLDLLIIPDISTRMAAIRTGKVDVADEIPWEEMEYLVRSQPAIQARGAVKYGYIDYVALESDRPPFDDIRVRRAMNMAIDRQTMLDTFFGGHGYYWGWMTVPMPEHSHIHIPFDELPQETQDIYTYNPEGAIALLAEAGYPSIKTTLHTSTDVVEELSILKEYWRAIGVDVELKPYESGTYTSIKRGFRDGQYHGMMFGHWWVGNQTYLGNLTGTAISAGNYFRVDVPFYDEGYEAIQAAWPDEDEMWRIFKELQLDVLSKSYFVNIPPYFEYQVWWPWVKQYHGEWSLGYVAEAVSYAPFIWMDTELRKSMGY